MGGSGTPELTVLTDFLRQCLPFDSLPAAVLERCARHISVRYLPVGAAVSAPTESAGLCVLRSGMVDILVDGELRQRLESGDSFGLPLPYPDSAAPVAKVVEDSLIYLLPVPLCHTLRSEYPQFEAVFSPAAGLPSTQGGTLHLLSQPIGPWMSRGLVTVAASTSAQQTAAQMTARRVSSTLVVDAAGYLQGIVTDRDLRSRLVAVGGDGGQPVSAIMSAAPLTLAPSDTLLDATLLMSQRGIHHVPVVSEGRPVGMLTASDLFLARQEDPVFFVQHLGRQADAAGLAKLLQGLPGLFHHWVRGGLPPAQIGRLSNMVSEAVTRRLIELAIMDLGPPPGAFCWLSFGSQARGEQLLGGDQDNGLVIDDAVTEAELPWFAALAERVCDGLNACGYVYCPGGVMAKNPQWCQRLHQWLATVDQWMTSPTPGAVMRVSIFFDLRGIWGELSLSEALQRHMMALAKANTIFQAALARNVLENTPPLGLLHQFVVERNGEHRRQFDLKKRGVLPVIEIVRLRALSAGISAVSTVGRLEALAASGQSNSGDVAALRDAYTAISRLRIELQAEQVSRGDAVHNYCDPSQLSRLSRHHLRAAFGVIHDAQSALRLEYLQGLG